MLMRCNGSISEKEGERERGIDEGLNWIPPY